MLPAWLRRRARPATTDPATERRPLDALVTLGPHHLPAGARGADATASVKAAIALLPHAGWVSVEYHPMRLAESAIEWVELDAAAPDRSAAFRAELASVVAHAISGMPATGPTPPVQTASEWSQAPALPGPAPGFAEVSLPSSLLPRSHAVSVERAVAPSAMSDTLLLERLLGLATGMASGAAAPRVIKRFGSLAHALAAPADDLLAVPGVGEHSVSAIKLVHALVLRSARGALMGQPVTERWDDLLAYLRSAVAREKIEQFRILFLDSAGVLVGDEAQARGTVNHTPVYPREVVRRALELRARSLVLVHNHPGGDPTPSAADVDMTAQIEAAGRVVGVSVYDHVIISAGPCFSFRDSEMLAQ